MDIKEKARELVDSFADLVATDYQYNEEPIFESQKQCALLAVDEKIQTFYDLRGSQEHMLTESEKDYRDNLLILKQEINTLKP
jgi:hypothetical protein